MRTTILLAILAPIFAFAQGAVPGDQRRSAVVPAGVLCYCEAVKDRNIYEKDSVQLRLYNTSGRVVVLRHFAFEGSANQKKTVDECDKARMDVPFCQWSPQPEN